MTTGAMERFWKEGHGHIPSARLVTRRAFLRALFFVAALLLVYHVMTSVELRGSFANVRDSVAPVVHSTATTAATAGSEQELHAEALAEDSTQHPPQMAHGGPKVKLGKEKATLLMLVRWVLLSRPGSAVRLGGSDRGAGIASYIKHSVSGFASRLRPTVESDCPLPPPRRLHAHD